SQLSRNALRRVTKRNGICAWHQCLSSPLHLPEASEGVAAEVTPSQIRFLTLHAKRSVDRWQWHFSGCTLRAWADKRSASLGREELQGLVAAGLMKLGLGVSVSATPAGRTWV